MEISVTFVDASSRFPWLQDVKYEAEQAQIESLRARAGSVVVTDDDMADLIDAVSNVSGVEVWLKPIVNENPDDLFAASLLAERMVVHAWESRPIPMVCEWSSASLVSWSPSNRPSTKA